MKRYSSAIAEAACRRKKSCDCSWRMDETYIKLKAAWVYLFRAVGKQGKTLDFMLSQRRNKPTATKFFARMLEANDLPREIVIDKTELAQLASKAINKMLKLWLPDPNRDGKEGVSEQHFGAGPSLPQETNSVDLVQILLLYLTCRFSVRLSRRSRNDFASQAAFIILFGEPVVLGKLRRQSIDNSSQLKA